MKLQQTPIITLAIVIISSAAYACMFGPPYRTVCDKYAFADVVITGTIDKVELKPGLQIVEVTVGRTFKGSVGKKITIEQDASTCDREFMEFKGKNLLLYLIFNKSTKLFNEITPDAGDEEIRSPEELSWLMGLPGSLRRTRIAGTVEIYKDRPFEFIRSLSGVPVKIVGRKSSYTAVTDKNGVFELWDLPPAKYTIAPVLPPDFIFDILTYKGDSQLAIISKIGTGTPKDLIVDLSAKKCGGGDYVLNVK